MENFKLSYVSPRLEVIRLQAESNFMGDSSRSSVSASFGFGDTNGVEDGGEL